ncbi:MAG: TonB-dependent receptor [Bacteroidota bacterium]
MRRVLLILLCLGTALTAFSQRPGGWGGKKSKGPSIIGTISGTLIDSTAGTPIEFATVVLIDSKTQKQLDGTITDNDGDFKLEKVKTGTYDISVSFLGYNTKTIKAVALTLEKPDANLKGILLSAEGVVLDAVEVTGQAAAIENKIDKIVYNPEKDVTTAGTDATELLRRVPLVSVDFEGNVSLRGSNNVLILINGKPSSIFSGNVSEALQSIPSDQIKKVEVITTPTAKYDGEGTAGIINIITKKKSVEGFTGALNTSIGNISNRANLSMSLARGRFGMNFNAGSWFSWPREGTSTFYREDNDGNILQQDGTNTNNSYGPNGSVSAFYDINAYNSITSSLTFRGFGRNNEGTTQVVNTGENTDVFERFNDSRSLRGGFDWSTDYRKTFKTPDQELVFAFQLSGAQSFTDNTIDQVGNREGLRRDLLNENDGLNFENIFQADYTHPFKEGLKMETGVKAIIRDINSDFSNFDNLTNQIVADQTDVFNYEQDVLAGYISFNVNITEDFGLVAGARYEHTTIAGDFDSGEITPFTNTYDNILPSIILSHKFKNFQTLKLSYSRRIQRPSLFFVNPFVNVADDRNISFGNPDLDPELTDQIDLSYNTFIKGIVLNASVFYRRTTDVIERFTTLNSQLARSETEFLNIGQNNSIGFNFFGSATIAKFWTLRGGFNLFTYDTESTAEGINLSNQAVLWNGNVNSSMDFGSGWRFEIFGFFRSPRQTIQGTRAAFQYYSMGARKEFSKKLSLGIQVISPFNRDLRFPNSLVGDNFIQRSEFSVPFRSFNATLRWSFGKLDFKKKRVRSAIDNSDQKSGGDGGNY